jgi:hypothetical protein
MALPSVIGMFSTSDLYAPRELQEGVEISIEITHSDTHQTFPLIVFNELKGGTSFFPFLDQQI